MAEILQLLRNQTREVHERMETLVPVFSETFTVGDYRRLLERFYGFYAEFESAADGAPGLQDLLPDWQDRKKLPLLKADLLTLGLRASDLQKLAVPRGIPPVHTRALLFGALYVTEGSTLGGLIICRHIGRSLGMLPGQGASFFYGHGAQTGRRWKTFIHALSQVATPETERQIVRSAVNTFESMGSWLSENPMVTSGHEHEELESQLS